METNKQVAIVTGASSGLGRRFSELLAREGAVACCLARRVEKLESLREAIEKAGGTAHCYRFDAADTDECDRVFGEIAAECGTPTLLVNCAGISFSAKAEKMPMEDFKMLMQVNLHSPWRLSQLCAEQWIAAGTGGTIVNVSSLLGKRVQRGVAAYAMSKAALTHMTAAHALEWARHGIRVNALCPGYVRTEINAEFWNSPVGEAELHRLPRRRIAGPEALDRALLFLADPANDYLNGEALYVDDAQGWAL